MIESCSRRTAPGLGIVAGLGLVAPRRAPAQFLKSRDRTPAPELRGVTAWINSDPLTMKGLRDKVVAVHSWTHGCSNGINNYPHYKAWQDRYAAEPLFVIPRIHTPEMATEHDIKRTKKLPIAEDQPDSFCDQRSRAEPDDFACTSVPEPRRFDAQHATADRPGCDRADPGPRRRRGPVGRTGANPARR